MFTRVSREHVYLAHTADIHSKPADCWWPHLLLELEAVFTVRNGCLVDEETLGSKTPAHHVTPIRHK